MQVNNIDFKNSSHIKETPNISSASNMKSYARFDSESGTYKHNKKFTRHTRDGSIFDNDNVPVKEVYAKDYCNSHHDPVIANLKSFYEPNNEQDQVVIEYENIEDNSNMVSPIEIQPSVRLDESYSKSKNSDNDLESEMSSDIKNDSMVELFDQNHWKNFNVKALKISSSKLEMNDLPKTSPSLSEANKFKTFNESKTSKNTIIEK